MSSSIIRCATYKAQLNVGYLVKRAHSLMLDIMEPVSSNAGFSFVHTS